MSRWINIDDERNVYCGTDGMYAKWYIDTDVLDEAMIGFDKEYKWLGNYDEYTCPSCKMTFKHLGALRFCPNCGVKFNGIMDVGGEVDD